MKLQNANARVLVKGNARFVKQPSPLLDIPSPKKTKMGYDSLEAIAEKIKLKDLRDLFKKLFTPYFNELSNYALASTVRVTFELLDKRIRSAVRRAEREGYGLDGATLLRRYIVQLHRHLSQHLKLAKQNIRSGRFANESGKIEGVDVRYWMLDFEFRPYDEL